MTGPVRVRSFVLRGPRYRLGQSAIQKVKEVSQSIFCCGFEHWNLQLLKVMSLVIRQL